ncbi:MAG: class I SAM-dependent methyltransferase [Acidobacteria bacterium]|jgi:ubiquinone/menaquinone biosynthesis C-methylase UbiE|nr:class I SAM-dependent methyltransferase [Acidobacteriota bacterium]MCW5949419.1 class I SAM-dependent methyltransferase [Pyrinomonadaceae bacterium]
MKTESKENYIPALGLDFLTPFYDTVVKWTTREKVFKRKLVEQIEIPSSGRLLDLACGTATLTVALKRKFPQVETYGLDGDAKILRIARRKAAAGGVEIIFNEAFATALPYPDEHFDVIVTSLFFHHLTPANKRKTLGEILRVLKPGGTLHVADWGKAANILMKAASQPIIWLDGASTEDSLQGKLPELVAEAGFAEIDETANFGTVFGTIRIHKARKPL